MAATMLPWIGAAMRAGLLAGAVLVTHGAAAHAVLKQSDPAAGATLSHSPKEVVITFNEKVEAAFSSLSVKDASGKDVASGKGGVDSANPAVLRVGLPALAAGGYVVKWAAVGHDGHRRSGEFKFAVK